MRLSLPPWTQKPSGESPHGRAPVRKDPGTRAETTLELQISFRTLLVGLFLTVVPTCLIGLYSLAKTEQSVAPMVGGHFRDIAEGIASGTAQFMHERVIDVWQIAADPVVVDAVTAANQGYRSMTEPAIRAKMTRIEENWTTPAGALIVKDMLSSRASRTLRRHRELDSRILRITVTDEKGGTIAATHKSLDYIQSDEEYWQNIYAQGRGAISVTDILYDEATKANYIGIGVPILEEGSNRFIGTMDALVDVSTLFPIVNRAQTGTPVRSLLVKNDGTIVSGPRLNLSMKLKSAEYEAARDEMGTLRGRENGYLITDVSGVGRTMIAFADPGLREDYPKLDWMVLVCQETREAFAPTLLIGRLIAFMSLAGLAMVTLLAMYFAIHRRQSFTEIGGPQLEEAPQPEAVLPKQ